MGIMEQKREEMKKEFLALTPLQRIQKMEKLFNEQIKLIAKRERITEGEAYLRFLDRSEKLQCLLKPKKVRKEKEDKDLLL
jgi:hypothetical protein